MQQINRGEIFFVDLGPPSGRRPCVVLSINDINRKPLEVAVIPGTSWRPDKKFHSLTQVKVVADGKNGLTKDTLFKCHQIKSLDHSKFDQGPSGKLSADDLARIEKKVGFALATGLPLYGRTVKAWTRASSAVWIPSRIASQFLSW